MHNGPEKYYNFCQWIDALEIDINERAKARVEGRMELALECLECQKVFDGGKYGLRSRFEENTTFCSDECSDAWDEKFIEENLADVFDNLSQCDQFMKDHGIATLDNGIPNLPIENTEEG